ncbi:hypothetical protein HY449_01675 [Candidatus Pacearchaeota archaeon]|nr:hypothetical protein [Candidatus Pacearchaeota archaeon]
MAQKEPWKEFKYKYSGGSEFLRFLVTNLLSDKGVAANVYLEVPEMEMFWKERSEFSRMDEQTFKKNFDKYRNYLSRILNKNIIPHYSLDFNGGDREPRVKNIRYIKDQHGGVIPEAYELESNPANFSRERFQMVYFEGFNGEEQMKKLKESVGKFVEGGRYEIFKVSAGLNPRSYTSDHYYDGVDYDGRLFAGGGNLEIGGHFPEDFDFRIFVPKSLPEGQKMLEQLVRTK